MSDKDLRVIRTKNVLKNNLKDLLLHKNIEQISVKELCETSMINRRTFYLHYDSIYDLLSEILEDMALEFLEYTKGYDHFKEIDRIVSDYFHFTHNNPLYEKLNNNPELDYIREQINDKVVQNSRGELESAKKLDVHLFNITRIYLNASTVAIYRYWHKNQRTLSMDAAINMAVSMIKDGCH